MLSTRWRCTTLVLSRCRLESKLKRTKKKGERKKKRVVPRLYIDVCQPTQKKKKQQQQIKVTKENREKKKRKKLAGENLHKLGKKNVIRDVLDEYKKKEKENEQ